MHTHMMSINFLDPIFHSTVSSSCPSVDGHQASNLLSGDETEQNRGFLPETFIKPPINIELTLPCKVDLHRVILNTVVGAQKTSGVELYSCSANGRSHLQHKQNLQRQGASLAEDGTNSAVNIFVKIAYGNVQEEKVVCFNSGRFKARRPFRDLDPMKSRHSYHDGHLETATFTMYHHNDLNICSVHSINVRLTRPVHGKLCGIKWLEVWGQPAYSCSRETIQDILDRYSMAVHRQMKSWLQPSSQTDAESNVQPPDQVHAESTKSIKKSSSIVSIPEEFLDPVTLEVMSMPMLVPSGQTLDQQTLDKHYAQEAKWGRPPNNPFTAVPFTSSSQPVPNTGLKSRIDQFLLQHGADLLPVMGRALGSTQCFQGPKSKISSLLSNSASNSAQQRTVSQERHAASLSAASATNKLESDETVSRGQRSAVCSIPEITDRPSVTTVKRPAGSPSTAKRRSVANTGNSVATSSPTIDEVLSSTLQSLPSYLKPKQTTSKELKKEMQCSVCCKVDASCYYQLQCRHVVCRCCLTGQSEGDAVEHNLPGGATGGRLTSCGRCGTTVCRQEVTRLHQC